VTGKEKKKALLYIGTKTGARERINNKKAMRRDRVKQNRRK